MDLTCPDLDIKRQFLGQSDHFANHFVEQIQITHVKIVDIADKAYEQVIKSDKLLLDEA